MYTFRPIILGASVSELRGCSWPKYHFRQWVGSWKFLFFFLSDSHWFWSNYSDLTRPPSKSWWKVREIPLFQGNLGWWKCRQALWRVGAFRLKSVTRTRPALMGIEQLNATFVATAVHRRAAEDGVLKAERLLARPLQQLDWAKAAVLLPLRQLDWAKASSSRAALLLELPNDFFFPKKWGEIGSTIWTY